MLIIIFYLMLDYINNLYPMPSSKTIENATNADVCKQKPSIIDQMSDGEQKKNCSRKIESNFLRQPAIATCFCVPPGGEWRGKPSANPMIQFNFRCAPEEGSSLIGLIKSSLFSDGSCCYRKHSRKKYDSNWRRSEPQIALHRNGRHLICVLIHY